MAKNYITYINEKTPKEQLNRSIEMCREALRNEPDSLTHRISIGLLLIHTGDMAGAKREFEIVMSTSNDDKLREIAENYLKRLTDQQDG